MSTKYLYLFTEGNADMRELLGGKGANLAEMTNLGMPVPQGFTITTEACNRYYDDGRTIAPEIESDIIAYMAKLEEITGKKFEMPKPASRFSAFGCESVHAGYDGYYSQPRHQ